MSYEHLFIGGEKDGERMAIEPGLHVVEFARNGRTGHERYTYRRRRFEFNASSVDVFVHEETTELDFLRMLLENYQPKMQDELELAKEALQICCERFTRIYMGSNLDPNSIKKEMIGRAKFSVRDKKRHINNLHIRRSCSEGHQVFKEFP